MRVDAEGLTEEDADDLFVHVPLNQLHQGEPLRLLGGLSVRDPHLDALLFDGVPAGRAVKEGLNKKRAPGWLVPGALYSAD